MRGIRPAYVLLLVSLVATVSAAEPGRPGAPLRENGAVHLYVEPFPDDAARLAFRFDQVFAVRADGTELPLTPSFTEAVDGRPTRPRLLATGALPPGQYRGLSIRVSAPTIQGEAGPLELTSPEAPTRVDVPFRVRKRQFELLSLSFLFKGSVGEDSRFQPIFTADLAVRPAVARLALVTNPGANTVTLFDKVSSRVVAVIPTGLAPGGIALDQRRGRAYVAISGEDAIIAIGLPEYAVVDRSPLRAGDTPVELALTPDGETLITANLQSNTVSLIDASSLTETDRIEVGNEPRSVIVDPTGTRAYVFNSDSSNISVIDVRDAGVVGGIPNRLVGTISTDAEPIFGQFNRAGDALYVIHRISSRLSVIDPTTLAVREKVYIGPKATALEVDPRSDLVYLSRSGTKTIEIFDPLAFLPVDSIPVSGDVGFLALDVEQNYLYVALPALREIQVIEIVGNKLRGRTELGGEPYWVAVNGER